MSNEISLKFGALTFDTITTITDIRIDGSQSIKTYKIPKTHGSIAETAFKEKISISAEGDVFGADYDTKRTNLDTLKAAFYSGRQKFTKDDDRYLMAELEKFNDEDVLLRNLSHWYASFIVPYPFWLAELESSDDHNPATSGAGYTVNNAGNAITRVKILITAPGGGIADNIQVENITRGELLKYRGTLAAGNVLEIDNRYDTDDFQVLNNAADDTINFEGDFLNLSPGNNTIEFTGTAGTRVRLYWRAAWH